MGTLGSGASTSTYIYFKQVKKLVKAEGEDEQALWKAARSGNGAQKAAFNRLVEMNLKLVPFVANKFRKGGTPTIAVMGRDYDDMIQDGNLGLLKAVERFEPAKGFRFSSYAYGWIFQKISRSLDEDSLVIRLPAEILPGLYRWNKERDRLRHETTGEPAADEINVGINYAPEKVERLGQAQQFRMFDIDGTASATFHPKANQWREDEYLKLHEIIGDNEPSAEEWLLKREEEQRVHDMLAQLPERQAQVLKWRSGIGDEGPLSLKEIGEKLGLSRERVRQVEVSAENKIRAIINRQNLLEDIIVKYAVSAKRRAYTEKDKDAFLSELASGISVNEAAKRAGISPATLYTTWKKDEAFTERFKQAKKIARGHNGNGNGATEPQFNEIIKRASQPIEDHAPASPYTGMIADLEAQKEKIDAAIAALRGLEVAR